MDGSLSTRGKASRVHGLPAPSRGCVISAAATRSRVLSGNGHGPCGPPPGRPHGPLPRRSEHFAHEMLHGAGRGATEAAASERPQFSCGVRLRWRRETCGPEHRGRPVHILKCRTLQGKSASRIRRFHQKFLCGLKPPPSGGKVVDKTAKPMKSFFVTPPFREGQSARPLSVGCGVSRRMGRLWIETCSPAGGIAGCPEQPGPRVP